MKVSLKSQDIDLEIDGVEKLDDVLEFVKQFFKLELESEMALQQLDLHIAKEVKSLNKKTK